MEIFAALSVGILVLIALFIAIKTFGLWRRTRGLPELLLTGMLFSSTVLGYPLTVASTLVSPEGMWPLLLAGQAAFCTGYTCLLLFTLNVFRRDVLWARCLVGLTLLMLAGVSVKYALDVLAGTAPAQLSSTSMITTLPIAVAYFWTTIESLVYHRKLRLQVGLGLADVVVTNRVLLWGLMCLSAGAAVVVSSVAMLFQGALLSPAVVLVCSGLGLAHAGCLFLAFHPPAGYAAWLKRGSAAAAS